MLVVASRRILLLQITFLFLIGILKGVGSVKILALKVPHQVKAGIDVSLSCHYELEEENLYSLNWWRGTHQFYQYSPDGPSHQVIYETDVIKVNKMESSLKAVVLKNVSVGTSGEFKCEVVTDYPVYSRDSRSQHMEVIEVPHSRPRISLWKTVFELGERFTANCSLPYTTPPPKMRWYINGKKINQRSITNFTYNQRRFSSKEESSPPMDIKTGVSFILEPSHFIRDGRAVLTCVAEIPELYRSSSEVRITLPGVISEPSLRISGSSRMIICSLQAYAILYGLFSLIATDSSNGLRVHSNSLLRLLE